MLQRSRASSSVRVGVRVRVSAHALAANSFELMIALMTVAVFITLITLTRIGLSLINHFSP